ncbi:MAG: PAS domain S-box protein [Planctomycetales bacterium]|nr:PAS domain S-box protein [Planctomycetales bacterium]
MPGHAPESESKLPDRPQPGRSQNEVQQTVNQQNSQAGNPTARQDAISPVPRPALNHADQIRIRALESALQDCRETMQATIDSLKSENQELRLQNTNLQSENVGYRRRVAELEDVGNDMENLLNSTDVHTLFLDRGLAIRKFTPRMGQVFKLDATDIGTTIDRCSHNIPCDGLLDKISDVLRHGDRYDEEIAMPDGVVYLLRILPYQTAESVGGVVLTIVDITESKEAEARFRATFDNAAVGIAHVALDGRWLKVNKRICEILGYEERELLDKTFQDVTYPDDLGFDLEHHAALIRGDVDRYSIEKRYIRKDGELVWISLTVALQHDLKRQPHYAIKVVQDISKRKAFERGLEQSIEQRDRFLATLSHELRNPLAALRHAIRLVRHDRSSDEQRTAAMRTIQRQSEQMSFLLDDLLDVSRITQGKIVYDMRPLDMREVLRDAEDALRPTFQAQHHSFTLKLPPKPVVVMGDVSRLMQVVENLLTNACKYTDPGGKINVTLRRYDGWCILKVKDNGRGIESKEVENVFDMFVQSDTGLARREGGMGLGLTVVRSLVESHQGTISANSAGLGLGSTFTVRIPLTENVIPRQEDQSEGQFLVAPDDHNISIVLVEDNDDSREMLSDFLELEGFVVSSCADGKSGLDELVKQQPSIALVDLGLPEIDGYEVARQFRERCPDAETYLISLSGYGQTSDILKSERAGFDNHMTKPVDPDELASTLKSLARTGR